MVPKIASSGGSFRGAALYYLHDKGARTTDRVAWTHTENLTTNDPDRAWRQMAATALRQDEIKRTAGGSAGGRKLQKPVFCMSVAWHPEQDPDRHHMLDTAKAAVAALGMERCEAIYVCHDDEPHSHVHVILNRVDPETGRAASDSRSKAKLSEWAAAYERDHGKIYCDRPERENGRKTQAREAGKGSGKHRPPEIAAAWERSDSGKAFQAAIGEHGWMLARGDRGVLAVDRYGKHHNIRKLLDGVKERVIQAKLADLNGLPDIDEAKGIQAKRHDERKRRPRQLRRQFNRRVAGRNDAQQRHEQQQRARVRPRAAENARKTRDQERTQRRAERRAERLDGRHNYRLASQQNRQLDEKGELLRKQIVREANRHAEIGDFYRVGDLKAELDAARKAVEERTAARTVIGFFTGRNRREREQLEAAARNLDNAERRMAEAIRQIALESRREAEALERRHRAERDELRQRNEREKADLFAGRDPDRQPERTPRRVNENAVRAARRIAREREQDRGLGR